MADTQKLLIIGGVAVAGWYAYTQGWLASLFGTPTTTTVVPTNTSTTSTSSGTPAAPPASTTQETTSTPAAPPAPAATGTNIGGGSTLQALIAAAGGGNPTLTVDQWNYYLQQIQPNAVVTDLSSIGLQRGTPGFTLTAAQYLQDRTQAGLSGLGRYHAGPSNRIPRRALQIARWRMR